MLTVALTICTTGATAVLVKMMLGNVSILGPFASVKWATDESLIGPGRSLVEMTWVSVKLNDAPGAMLATVAELLPVAAWMASASMLPNRVLVNESLGLLRSSTRLGLSDELVFLTV